MKAPVQYIEVQDDRLGQRIDNFLVTYLDNVPKSLVYRWLRKGEVRVNKGRVKPTYRLKQDDVIRVPPVETKVKPVLERLTVDDVKYLERFILYEDKDLMVLNKPFGLAVHGGSNIDSGLIERLRILRPYAKKLELVHRLDRETSGCLLIAKKYSVLTFLHQQLRDGKMQKIYHAVVQGAFPNKLTQINKPIKKNIAASGERFSIIAQDGKVSLTKLRLLKNHNHLSLLELMPITGRTHQLRIHLKSVGYPILGDDKYNITQSNNIHKAKRLMLHARSLSFIHPQDQKLMTIDAEHDGYFKEMLELIDASEIAKALQS